ncbi:SH3 domain-containing protein C23A1.17-like [Leptopilina heterotoma]|uniref:SH3 domain-containing protein C23A1.17-like n=1 Tax=Leptopilina heterotoma TaxID=63436 RepID=UPI001CA9896F|nr:SH3 domain-containing protein C23A1.17-like [Leptopilina heterotoma]
MKNEIYDPERPDLFIKPQSRWDQLPAVNPLGEIPENLIEEVLGMDDILLEDIILDDIPIPIGQDDIIRPMEELKQEVIVAPNQPIPFVNDLTEAAGNYIRTRTQPALIIRTPPVGLIDQKLPILEEVPLPAPRRRIAHIPRQLPKVPTLRAPAVLAPRQLPPVQTPKAQPVPAPRAPRAPAVPAPRRRITRILRKLPPVPAPRAPAVPAPRQLPPVPAPRAPAVPAPRQLPPVPAPRRTIQINAHPLRKNKCRRLSKAERVLATASSKKRS